MKPNPCLTRALARLTLAPACVLLLATNARAQTAATSASAVEDAQNLARYDANRNGVLDPAERAALETDRASAARAGGSAAGAKSSDVVEMSPFTVVTGKDTGYFAENTLAGSRLNTNLADIAASITVVTKQQLEDTASLDINDVFKYEANTEGSASYTPLVTDRGTAKDTIGGYTLGNDGGTTTNAQSNRVRGLAAPDVSMDYYTTNSRIPFDTYNTQSIEISRGPNSLLFGMGSPAGIVNQTTARAALNQNTNNVTLRTDHVGSFRSSLAFNRSLIPNKLAVFGAFLYNDQQFERKPSFELTRRQFGAITAKPFSKTVLRAYAENFNNRANRPNFISPRDYVTPWLQAGRPAYDPVARTITIQDTNRVLGPYVFDNRSPGFNPAVNTVIGTGALTTATSPLFIPFGISFDTGGSPLERFDNGRRIDYFQRAIGFYVPAHTNPATPVPSATSLGWATGDPRFALLDRQWTFSSAGLNPTTVINGTTYTYSSYQAPAVSNRSIYDWTEHNINEPNFGQLRAGNYNIEFEQQLLDNLHFSAGWLRQDIDSSENYILSQLQGNTIQIDTNTRLPNGQPNPYFGLPLTQLGVGNGVDTFFQPETDDNYRAMLAYDLDLTKRSKWLSWLGRHRLLGLWSLQEVDKKVERWRLGYRDGDAEGRLRYTRNLLLPGQAHWNLTNIKKAYYLASPGDAQARTTQSAGYYGNPGWNAPYVARINAYNFNTNDFHDVTVTEQISFSDAGSFRSQREVESLNFAVQSYLWNDRLVATLGWRRDDYRARRTTTGSILDRAGNTVAPGLTQAELYADGFTGDINRDLVMRRFNRWDELSGNTKTLGAAFRPLKGWSFVERPAEAGSVVGDFLRGLTLYYNQSDNFNPPPGAQTDYFKRPLPKPTGDGKDGGFGFNLFSNKLVARVNWFETANQNERTSAAGTLLTRSIYSDTTTGIPWASAVQRIRNGIAAGRTLQQIVAEPNWNTENVNPVGDEANQRKIYDLIQLPYRYYDGISTGATQQSQAKGVEVQVTYNPTRNWTMKLTGSKQKTVYQDVAPQYDEWIAERMPKWLSSAAPEIPDFVDGSGRRYSLSKFWTGHGFSANAQIENTNGQTSPEAYFNQVVVSEVALAKALQGVVSPNQRIYHASFLTNYVFREGRLKGFSVGGSQRWESKAAVGFYGKVANPLTPTVINASDPTRPVYLDDGNFYTDLWFSYSRRIFRDKINLKVQLNINNAFEDGKLQPIAVNWDGQPWAFRIIDPRQFILTTTFGF